MMGSRMWPMKGSSRLKMNSRGSLHSQHKRAGAGVREGCWEDWGCRPACLRWQCTPWHALCVW
jgi:hypothetical protein